MSDSTITRRIAEFGRRPASVDDYLHVIKLIGEVRSKGLAVRYLD